MQCTFGGAASDKSTCTTNKYCGTNLWTKKRRRIEVRTHHKILRWFAWDFWLPLVQPLIFCDLL